MAFARVNGVVLHFDDTGGSGPALVFSNSLGTDFRIWDDVTRMLAPHFRIVRYDKRGHGLSELTPAPYTIMDHVSDLAALLDQLGTRQAGIVGLSVGGMIAQRLAVARPDLVAALALCDTAHRIGTADLWNGRIDAIAQGGIASLAEAIMQRWFTPEYRRPDNPDFVGYTAMLLRTPAEGYTGTCAAIRDADLAEMTSKIGVPSICIVGDQDGSTPPALVRELADIIPGARFEVISDAGHLPCIEQPERLAALIREFMTEHLKR